MKKFIYIIFLSLISISCNERQLGDGYYYLPKYEAIDIGYPKSEAIIYKSSQEYLFNNIIIRGDVLEVKINSKFIIAKRNPINNTKKNTNVFEYFIILKKKDSIIGPLTFKKLKDKSKILGINLKLN